MPNVVSNVVSHIVSRLAELRPSISATLLPTVLFAACAADAAAQAGGGAAGVGGLRAYWHVFIAYAIVILLVLGWVISIGRRLKDIQQRLGE
jgi:CcmD family protein